jgi:hypothetical protein
MGIDMTWPYTSGLGRSTGGDARPPACPSDMDQDGGPTG